MPRCDAYPHHSLPPSPGLFYFFFSLSFFRGFSLVRALRFAIRDARRRRRLRRLDRRTRSRAFYCQNNYLLPQVGFIDNSRRSDWRFRGCGDDQDRITGTGGFLSLPLTLFSSRFFIFSLFFLVTLARVRVWSRLARHDMA